MYESAKQMQLNEALDRLNKAGLIVEAEDEYRQKVVNKLAGIIDRCYDLDDKGHSYANDIASRWEKHIAETPFTSYGPYHGNHQGQRAHRFFA